MLFLCHAVLVRPVLEGANAQSGFEYPRRGAPLKQPVSAARLKAVNSTWNFHKENRFSLLQLALRSACA